MKVMAVKFIVLLLSGFALTSCAVINEPYYYNEIVIRNNTNEVLRDVKIQSMKTNQIFRCANVPPGSQCSDKFPKRKTQRAKLKLLWVYKGQERSVEDVFVEIPDHMHKEIPLRGVLVVNADGTLRIFVEQVR